MAIFTFSLHSERQSFGFFETHYIMNSVQFLHGIKKFFLKYSARQKSENKRKLVQNFLFAYVEKRKHKTAEKLQLILRCIFDPAASDYKLDSPMVKIVLPRHQSKKGSAFTYTEEKQLVDYCTSHPDLAASDALLVLLYTGMRRSELKALRVLDENWLECDTSKEKMGQDTVPRRIPVTPMLRKVLPSVDFEKAKDTNVNTINTMIKRLFPHHHTHELQYTYITRCKECGINHELVMLWDGHFFDKDVKTSVVDNCISYVPEFHTRRFSSLRNKSPTPYSSHDLLLHRNKITEKKTVYRHTVYRFLV